ncbi:MAG: alpha/beta hydrolase-fold protein [Acidobacteriota bacterium]|jgi:enterochelin esterase-like enzyme
MKSSPTGFLSVSLMGLALLTGTLPAQTQPSAGNAPKGSVERIKVHGASLEGNLEGDSPDRDIVVYLPPSYAKSPKRRYPAVYFLHGYSVGVEAYVKLLNLPEMADNAIAAGAREMILVLPDAFTVYNGSMYSNSPTTGDWEGFLSRDLVAYIDSHYRTVADRNSRGLSGHSMGGYGTVRVGMKHPEVFSALYAMSSCCLMNNPALPPPAPEGARGRGNAPAPPAPTPASAQGNNARGPAAEGRGRGGAGFGNVMSAEAAAWSPDPANPPQYFDLPTKDGQIQPLVAAKWVANSPLAMVSQYVPNLKQYRAIVMDVGDKDGLNGMNVELDREFTRLGITHVFEQYDGDHGNRVASRFQNNLLTFFSQQLKFPAASRR